MSSTQNVQNKQSAPITKPCDRCQEQIRWNNTIRKFESVEFPGWQHACKLPCTTDGCENPVFFSNQAPKNPATGRSRPLSKPIPIDTSDGGKAWMLHTHSTDADQTVKLLPIAGVAAGQQTMDAQPEQKSEVKPEPKSQASSADPALAQSLSDFGQRLTEIEDYFSKVVVPSIDDMLTWFKAVKPKVDVIAGKIADGSITTATDILKENQKGV